MSEEILESARQFVHAQIGIMSSRGAPPNVSPDQYEALVQVAAIKFAALAKRS